MEKIILGSRGRKGRRYLWWLLGLVLILGLAAWSLKASRTPPPPPPKPAPAAQTPSRMEGLALTEIQDGDKRWILDAQHADFHNDKDEVHINGVRVEFLGSPGQHFVVRGEDGVLHTKTRLLTLKGRVEMKSQDLTLKTSVIVYQPAGRVLLAPEEVTLEGPNLKVQGKDLRVELAERKLTLAQHRLTQVKTSGWGALK